MSKKGNVKARAGSADGKAEATVRDEAIRYRAYELFLARNAAGAPGDSISDWLQAEGEIAGTETIVASDQSATGGVSRSWTGRSRAHDAS